MSFVIFALPRSRTAWLSRFLSYGDWHCGHDELRHARSLDDIRAWLAMPNTGTSETLAAPWWRTLRRLRPETKVLVVRRPIGEVVASLSRAIGPHIDADRLTIGLGRYDAKLRQIAARWPRALEASFADLVDRDVCKSVFEHCLPYPFDSEWWARLAPINIQCSFPHLIRYMDAHRPQLEKLEKIARHDALSDLMARNVIPPDGMTFQVEPFETFIRDARGLIADHLVRVGEVPDNLGEKNLPLMQLMSDLGQMQVVTARSNGRMFGYLMTVLSPSFERKDIKTAIETTFYAAPEMPGLGMKLQRFSLQALRENGRADEVFFRAGPRGSGPKMGALYRRLGAVADGELYRLNLKGC